MIVPSSRLLNWVAFVIVPCAALGGMVDSSLPLALAFIGLFLVIVILDAALGWNALEGVQAQLPPLVRLSKDQQGVIEIRIKNQRQKPKQLRVAVNLPPQFSAPQEELDVLLPAQKVWSLLPWPCAASRRGNFHLDKCYLEGASPLGFWAVRSATPSRCELRVYPNLLKERNTVALFLRRGDFGHRVQRQMGKGRDFEKLRDYISGDSYEDVHWKATAKRGRPVTKIFQIERTQEIYVVIDASRLSTRPAPTIAAPDGAADNDGWPPRPDPADTPLLERYITAALVLGLTAQRQGDLFGLITFDDRVENFVRAKSGQAHYQLCREAIYTLEPRQVTPDFDELCTFIRMRLRRRALLIFLTSLDDPVLAESFVRAVKLICRQHVILVNMMQGPEIHPLFSGAQVNRLDDLYRRLGGHILWNNLRELEKTLQRRGVGLSLVQNEKLSAQLLTQYLTVKRRQLL
jgi:uncharacterized protein (DUF58 family)